MCSIMLSDPVLMVGGFFLHADVYTVFMSNRADGTQTEDGLPWILVPPQLAILRPWPTQFSGQVVFVVFFDLLLHRNIERSAQSIDTRTLTRDRVIASFPGAWERS